MAWKESFTPMEVPRMRHRIFQPVEVHVLIKILEGKGFEYIWNGIRSMMFKKGDESYVLNFHVRRNDYELIADRNHMPTLKWIFD